MIQTMLRNRQRQNPSHFSTLATISSLSAMSGMRCKTKTKATEKTPEASIHLKQGIQFEKIILWGFLVKITDPRPSLASGGCHATAWWFPRWDTGSFKNLIKAHISVVVTRVQDKHWVWKSFNLFFSTTEMKSPQVLTILQQAVRTTAMIRKKRCFSKASTWKNLRGNESI